VNNHPTISLTFTSRTHAGKKKRTNEDTILIREDLRLFIVADGMGGHQFGERASRIAVDEIQQVVLNSDKLPGGPDEQKNLIQKQILMDAFLNAHTAITGFAQKKAGGDIIGTTCTALWLWHNRAVACHIGDSILYHYNNDNFSQLTKEHSLVQELVDIGRLTREEARMPMCFPAFWGLRKNATRKHWTWNCPGMIFFCCVPTASRKWLTPMNCQKS